jgi:F0F1-type ATP synthase membrane subunit c/vacuolar-type H+-ATPase subunit K
MESPNSPLNYNYKNSIRFLRILSITPIIYFLLLYILDSLITAETPSVNPIPLDILLGGFVVVACFDVFLAFKVLIPQAKQQTDYRLAFSQFMITMFLFQSIGILGLLFGLLQLFVNVVPIDWLIVSPFLIMSYLIGHYTINNTIVPHLHKIHTKRQLDF